MMVFIMAFLLGKKQKQKQKKTQEQQNTL